MIDHPIGIWLMKHGRVGYWIDSRSDLLYPVNLDGDINLDAPYKGYSIKRMESLGYNVVSPAVLADYHVDWQNQTYPGSKMIIDEGF